MSQLPENPAPPEGFAADLFIQAGHQNTPDGKTGGESKWGREIDWTPIVADEAVRILRNAGVSTLREDASLKRASRRDLRFKVKLAVFLHFDDPDTGESGASVGYSHPSDEPAATAWKKLYSKFFPYRFMRDNFTDDEANYYGFRYTITTDAEFLIEFGDLGSPTQGPWLKARLKWLGALLAHFLSERIGKGGVPLPEVPSAAALDPESDEDKDLLALDLTAPALPRSIPLFASTGEHNLAASLPWQKASVMPQCDAYRGLLPGTFHVFHSLTHMPMDLHTAVYMETKFAIDSDGSSDARDPDHQSHTSLRHEGSVSYDARHESYGVIPLDRSPNHPKIAGLPNFGKDLGIRIGDVGVAFWRGHMAPFVIADQGPANAVGEGSIHMADRLHINSDPSNGGFNEKDVLKMGEGVVQIIFPGSGDVPANSIISRRSAAEVDALALDLLAKLQSQAAVLV